MTTWVARPPLHPDAAGATVFITDISEKALAAATQEIPGLLTAVCDDSKRGDIEATVPAAVEALRAGARSIHSRS